MKKLLIFFFTTLSFFIISSYFSKTVNAQVHECEVSAPGVPGDFCTVCNGDPLNCAVDNNQSTCGPTYYPDPTYCNQAMCPGISGPYGNCLEAPSCDNSGDSCTGPGTQGSCCDGLICDTNTLECTGVTSCIPANGDTCLGPAGTQSNCCAGLQCNYWYTIGVLECEVPDQVTGYRCPDTITGCIPCYTGDTANDCSPPEYCIQSLHPSCSGGFSTAAQALQACHGACSGTQPTRYRCDASTGSCVESGTGSYDNIADCAQACTISGGNQILCGPGDSGISTAIGCIPIGTSRAFTGFLVTWALGIAGGIAFVLIIYAGFMIITSEGNPQKLQAGKELLTSAIMGLVLLLFGAYLLRLIGVEILNIPGFGGN